ncbi:MAG: GNAT family N-acetyltransferase [Actinomycetes bacterium]
MVGTVCGMPYSSDLTDEQWALLAPVLNTPGKRGPKHAPDLLACGGRDALRLHTGCQWRCDVIAAAIGTLELGVPNPHCDRGRTVRLANVITLPEHRGRGYGTLLVRDVIEWARSIDADRVDLSATPGGERIYEKVGFNLTKAPRMKLVL